MIPFWSSGRGGCHVTEMATELTTSTLIFWGEPTGAKCIEREFLMYKNSTIVGENTQKLSQKLEKHSAHLFAVNKRTRLWHLYMDCLTEWPLSNSYSSYI